MALIGKTEAESLRAHLSRVLAGPVRIELFVEPEKTHFRVADECVGCDEARQLMEELAALSDKLELRVHVLSSEPDEARRYGVERAPSIVLTGAAPGAVRFTGLPLGGELTGLLEALVDISRGHSDLDAVARRALAGLQREVRLTLFVSASCPFCPHVARQVHRLAVESEKVKAEVIDADAFAELAERQGVIGVPTLLVDGEIALVGMQPEARLLGAISRVASLA